MSTGTHRPTVSMGGPSPAHLPVGAAASDAADDVLHTLESSRRGLADAEAATVGPLRTELRANLPRRHVSIPGRPRALEVRGVQQPLFGGNDFTENHADNVSGQGAQHAPSVPHDCRYCPETDPHRTGLQVRRESAATFCPTASIHFVRHGLRRLVTEGGARSHARTHGDEQGAGAGGASLIEPPQAAAAASNPLIGTSSTATRRRVLRFVITGERVVNTGRVYRIVEPTTAAAPRSVLWGWAARFRLPRRVDDATRRAGAVTALRYHARVVDSRKVTSSGCARRRSCGGSRAVPSPAKSMQGHGRCPVSVVHGPVPSAEILFSNG